VKMAGDVVEDIRLVLGAVASRPYRDAAAEGCLRGQRLTADTIAAAADAAYKPAKPMDNTDFVIAWRKHMVRQYVTRALTELAGAPG